MYHTLSKSLAERLERHEDLLKAMEADFAECAKTGKSPCFFCANDDTCDGKSCNFKWQPHK